MIPAFFVGFLIGFLLSIPIGPINLMVIHEAFRKSFARAFLIGLGGVAADTFYCVIAFFGFSSILFSVQFLWPTLQLAGAVVVLSIGFRYSFWPHRDFAIMTSKKESDVERFTKAFPVGFVIGISHVSLFVMWCIVNAIIISNHWIRPSGDSVLACVLGISSGSIVWFFFLSVLISKIHKDANPVMISKITRICGFLLLLFGIFLCYHALLEEIQYLTNHFGESL